MDWFRFYAEFAHDPKVQVMPEVMQRRLVMLFCLQCSNDLKKLGDCEIAFALRISEAELAETKALFAAKGFIADGWQIVNWEKRQYKSDTSAERVARYREKRSKMGVTSNGYTKHTSTVMERDGKCCVYCGSDKNLCIDHILPISQGGDDSIENLACACKACNSGKSGRTPAQAGYNFLNKNTEYMWGAWMSRRVTVTVTPPDTDTDTDTEQIAADDTRGAKISPDHAVGRKVLDLMGIRHDDPTWFGSYASVSSWIASGADPEMDIYPTITRVMAKRDGEPPRSLKYFDRAISDAVRDRTNPSPRRDAAPANGKSHPKSSAAAFDRLQAEMTARQP